MVKIGVSASLGGLVLIATLAIPTHKLRAQSPDSAQSAPDSISQSALSTSAPALPAAPSGVEAVDNPNDRGGSISVSWEKSPEDNGAALITGYLVRRSKSSTGEFIVVGEATQGAMSITDNQTTDGSDYYYSVTAFLETAGSDGKKSRLESVASAAGPARSSAQWFNSDRGICLIFALFISAAILYFIRSAKSGKAVYVRKIAGLEAVDEAVGRATEMGKKVLFVPGIQDMNDVQTIAGVAILGRVAELAAQYDTKLEAPMNKAMVMVTARETMKEAYTRAGRPDSYSDNQCYFVTEDQFGYAAAVDGIIMRDKPATIFYMGSFFAESLILSETGNAAGAIQIAGTAQPSQLPFFVAACDYTLIGEELFAASAYMSREPRQLGSLKGQDVGKAIFLALILIGVTLATVSGLSDSALWDVRQFLLVN